jgi:hypothetical protein
MKVPAFVGLLMVSCALIATPQPKTEAQAAKDGRSTLRLELAAPASSSSPNLEYWKSFVDLVRGLAWPTVVAFGLFYFRKRVGRLLDQLPGRASKLTIMSFSIEFAKVPQMSMNWAAGTVDVRRLSAAQMFDSNTADLIAQIAKTPSADFAVIDLGDGKQWLTSRLFIIAELLDRMRGLDCVVFVGTSESGRPLFLGTAHPRAVRWQLASAYPLLENSLVNAYQLVSLQPGQPAIRSSRGALDANIAADVLRNFLRGIQQPTPISSYDWVALDQSSSEFAVWLTPALLNRVFGDCLSHAAFEDSPDLSDTSRVEGIIRRPGSYVALTDQQGYFCALVDRYALLERAAVAIAQPASSTAIDAIA